MFGGLGWECLSTDELEQRLMANRAARSVFDAEDMEMLEVLDARQVATADGVRSLSEWAAARLDIGLDSAGSLVRVMRRTAERPDLRNFFAEGEATLDRVEAVSRIPENLGLMSWAGVAGVRREAARRARITVQAEFRSAVDQFLVLQPALD